VGLAASILLQTAFLPGLLPGFPKADPIFALMITMAILGYRTQSYFLGLAGGLVLDSLTGQYLGLNALSYLAVALIVSGIQMNLVKDALVAPAAVMFSGYFLKELVYLFVLVSIGLKFTPARVAGQLVIASSLNALLGIGLYWLLHFKLGLAVKVDKGY
jgi:rod shape-determining protein MreD